MDHLTQILKQEVAWYNSGGLNVRSLAVFDEQQHIYTVLGIRYPQSRHMADVVVLARIQDGKVVVEEDRTDRPLYLHLMEAGIPREQIILAYEGEALPE